jgi:4-amino-4-deoxy-L-arabinose transferase-like glycosyltransferase
LKKLINFQGLGMNSVLLFFITAIGMFLRFYDLGAKGLWSDESLFAFWVKEGNYTQETFPILLAHILGFRSEFWLRSISAFFGTMTIPAIYMVVKKRKLSAALIVAVFPLFVFWSRMARPYAVAGFFVVLGWRYWYAYIPALLTTPISVIGIRLVNWKFSKRTKTIIGIATVIIVAVIYLIRPDAGRHWTIQQVFKSSRWWYVPFITIMLYIFDYLLPIADRKFTKQPRRMVSKRGKVQRLAKRKKG